MVVLFALPAAVAQSKPEEKPTFASVLKTQ
jgi:hypothetical protein